MFNIKWKFQKDKSQIEKDTSFFPQCCKFRKYPLAFLTQSQNNNSLALGGLTLRSSGIWPPKSTGCSIMLEPTYSIVSSGRHIRFLFYSHRDLMKGLTQLESLNLEHNWLQHIAVQAFQHVDRLKQLTLSHNRLTLRGTETHVGEVQSVLNACLDLEELYVRNNSITTIFSDWVLTLLNLRTLDLSHNLISSLAVSMRDFMFPQHCCWEDSFSGMFGCVVELRYQSLKKDVNFIFQARCPKEIWPIQLLKVKLTHSFEMSGDTA